jgi:hypothetical protein
MWEEELLLILRALINDLDSTRYSDDSLIKVLLVAAFQVAREPVSFTQDFEVSVVNETITPDPCDTANNTDDADFVNLACLKAACIIDTGSAILAANNAVAGKDMNAVQFDLKGVASATLALLKQGWCATYKESLTDYIYGTNSIGRVVMGPFRTFACSYYGKQPF